MTISIDSAFPGGNIVLQSLTGKEVRLHQELRDTGRDWFYWCFKVRGAAGKHLRFIFTKSRALGVRGPAISTDQGKTWTWLGSEAVDGNSFHYAFPPHFSEVTMSFAMPYQESNWRRFMVEAGKHPAVVQDTLCVTPQGRKTEYVILQCENGEPSHRVAITCRHHCCEMMANYVLEGLIGWVLRDNEAEWLRGNVEFFLVPFVDKDGVEEGDQGKERKPRDHGRDYEGSSIFASTKAIRERLPVWGNGRLHVGLDLHCPWISGERNEVIYLVGSANRRNAGEQMRFGAILESVLRGPLPFSRNDFLPFGESWNTGMSYAGGKAFSCWISELPEVMLGAAIEVPYANARGAEVNQETARGFGIDLGRGLTEYLRGIEIAGTTR